MEKVPAPALLALRDQIDARWPQRSRVADGILGDAAHQARVSDHNDGNALDITHDPENGPDLEALAEALIADERTHYVIWNRRIRNRAFEGGAWRPYSGASPHTEHLHVSIEPARRADDSTWELPAKTRMVGVGISGALIAAGIGLLVAVLVPAGRQQSGSGAE